MLDAMPAGTIVVVRTMNGSRVGGALVRPARPFRLRDGDPLASCPCVTIDTGAQLLTVGALDAPRVVSLLEPQDDWP